MRNLGLTTILSLLLPLSVAGQSIPGDGYSLAEGTDPIPWPTSELGTAGDFHRVVFGSFTGDCSPDAAALVGDMAVLLFQPEMHKAVFEIETGVLQIDAVKPPLPENPWGLALAKSNGIWLHQHPSSLTQIASGSPWNGLTILRSGNFDNAGFDDLVGASGSNIHVLLHDGSSWSSGGSFATSGTVYAVVPVQWDTNDGHEMGILTSAGVEVRDAAGTLVKSFPGASSGGLLAPIAPMASYGQGRLAWSFPTASGPLLLVCHPDGNRTNCGPFLNPPATLSSGIYFASSSSRRVDLLTMASGDLNARWFMHEGSGNPYTPNALADETYAVGGAYPVGSCQPAFGDSNGDGAPDLLVGRPAEDAFYYVGGRMRSFGGTADDPPGGNAFVAPVIVQHPDTDVLHFRTHLILPANSNWGHVLVQVWRSEDGDELVTQAVANNTFSIALKDEGELFEPSIPGTHMQVWVDLPDEDLEDCELENAYFVTVRLVNLNSAGHIVQGSASVDAGFASTDLIDAITPFGSTSDELPDSCVDTLTSGFLTNPRWAVPTETPVPGPLTPVTDPFSQ